jgi:hypothetical protein
MEVIAISALHLKEFWEKFFLKGLTPFLLILIIYFFLNFKKIKPEFRRGIGVFLILIGLFDFAMRMHYTFILDRDNNTRYFLIQIILWTFPAALAFDFFLRKKTAEAQKKILYISCILFCLFSAIINIKPKWFRQEYIVFSEIIEKDPAINKYAFEYDEEDGLEEEVRLNYYSGIYKLTDAEKFTGTSYIVSKKKYDKILEDDVELVKEIKGSKKKTLYLYKTNKKISRHLKK